MNLKFQTKQLTERLHNPGHKMAAKKFSSVTVYNYRREGSLMLKEWKELEGRGACWKKGIGV